MANNKKEYSVVFTGFHNEKQAQRFASWFEGSGEQDVSNDLSGIDGIDAIEVDMDMLAEKMPKDTEILNGIKQEIIIDGIGQSAIIMPLKIYLKK